MLDRLLASALAGQGRVLALRGGAGIETAAQALKAELTSRKMGADLAGLITDAYEELSCRCVGITSRWPWAVRRLWPS